VDQSDLLKYAAEQLQRLGIQYAVVGSFASGVWGESRFTQDIDIIVDLRQAHVPLLCTAFPSPEFYVSSAAASEAVANGSQFNVINPSSGNKIDFMIAGPKSWVVAQLDRCKSVPVFPDVNVKVAAPEDVILGKLIYYGEGGSEKHLRDIIGILKNSDILIDHEYISAHAAKLGMLEMWEAMKNSFDRI
jgi:hypothetical protein